MVAVLSKTGIRLMPTSNYRARKLLARKKAVICGYRPFTIRLTERGTGDIQPVELAVDTGYFHELRTEMTISFENWELMIYDL